MSQLTVKDTHIWQLSGDIGFATVPELLERFTHDIQQHTPHTIDLAEVTRVDSAGVALMLEFCRLLQPNSLTFINMPAQMQHLAELSGVQDLLAAQSIAERVKP